MDFLIKNHRNKDNFYNELNDKCKQNEMYNILEDQMDSLSYEYNLFCKVDTFVKVFAGVSLSFMVIYGLSILNVISAILLLIGAYLVNKILEECLDEHQITCIAIRDIHYEVANGILQTDNWKNLSNTH